MDEQVHLEDQLVVAALKNVGVHVASSQDLMNTRGPYPLAIPVLIEFLAKVKTYAVKEIIVRSLATKAAKGKAEQALIEEFELSLWGESVEAQSFRWAVANTLELIGGKANVDDLMRLLLDPRSASARGLLSIAAAKTKDPRVIPILMDYLEAEDLQGFAARGLGKLRAKEAVPKLKAIAATTKNSWVRREAVKALERIGASSGGSPIKLGRVRRTWSCRTSILIWDSIPFLSRRTAQHLSSSSQEQM